jgi:hypothetical protein
MNLFFPFADPLENVGREVVVLKIVKAALDHLPQVKGFGAAGPGGEEISVFLTFYFS